MREKFTISRRLVKTISGPCGRVAPLPGSWFVMALSLATFLALHSGHHFWTHFWCGLVVGGALGAWISWGMFQSPWASVGLAMAIALLFASCAGKWGDPVWYWVLRHW